jgi:hypothetical protein
VGGQPGTHREGSVDTANSLSVSPVKPDKDDASALIAVGLLILGATLVSLSGTREDVEETG